MAQCLGVSCRTLRRWRQLDRQSDLQPTPRGRPCKESTEAEKVAALELLDQQGPHLGLPTLRAAIGSIPRCQWRDLQQQYRMWWAEHYRIGQQRLTWHRIGSVWAVDFSTPPHPVDGVHGKIFAARDLASGMQLAWLPVDDETAAVAVAVVDSLIEQHGAPLVLKSDNGSAFKSHAWQAMLARWQVTPLYSPPITPRYNGGCEASNGSMKTRTIMQAIKAGDAARWSSEMLAAATRQANALHRGTHPSNPTAQEKWASRRAINEVDRKEFQKALDAERIKVHNRLREATEDEVITARQLACQERRAVTQALVELGLLSVTWRSKALPINAKKAARIS